MLSSRQAQCGVQSAERNECGMRSAECGMYSDSILPSIDVLFSSGLLIPNSPFRIPNSLSSRSPSQVLCIEVDGPFDLDRADLEFRDLGDGIECPMGQDIGTGFRIMECHGDDPGGRHL